MQVSVFFTILLTNQKYEMKIWIFSQNVENTWKTVIQDSVFFSQCSQHIKKNDPSFHLFFKMSRTHQKPRCNFRFIILWTHQNWWCKLGSFFQSVVNTSKTVTQVSVFTSQPSEHIKNSHASFGLFIAMLWTNQKTCMSWNFFSQCCEHIKNRYASLGLFDNVVHTSKTWYNVSFSVFFLNIVNTSRRMMQVFVFFHNVVNKSKICDGNLGLFSKCWKHMKNRNARLGLFTTFSTHQKPS